VKQLPGVVVNVRLANGSSYTLASGVADLTSKRKIAGTDHFRVGSITKAMIATVLLQLQDEGRVAIDSSVNKYLPNIVPNGARISVRQLLNHTSGLASYTDDSTFIATLLSDPTRAWTTSELLSISARQAPYFAPGTAGAWAYSNTNYIVLGALVEKLTGGTVAQALQTRIFNRLGMTETSYPTTAGLPNPFAEGYIDITRPQENLPAGSYENPSWAGAAGVVVSTAADIARFAEAMAAGTLVSASAFAAQQQVVPGSVFRYPSDSFDTGYGLGAIVGGGWVGHNGAIPGYESQAFAKRGVGAIGVVINHTADDDTPREIYIAVRTAQFGK
jgi:D-alanyl-D-alanine carboxypeptidase